MEYQLADLFESIVDRVPHREALVFGEGERFTYRELDERANQVAHHLLSAGISRGDHVGCYMPNSPAYVLTILGCFKIGAVPVNVNYRYVEEELRYLFDDADLAGLVYDGEYADRVGAVAPNIDTLRYTLSTSDFDAAVTGHPTGRDFAPRSPDDIWLLYTGGTTGMPKGVMWRHEDIFFSGMGGGTPVGEPVQTPEELAERIDPSEGAFQLTMLVAPPLMHGAAQLGTFIGFWAGNRITMLRRYEGHAALALVEREKANTISLVGDAMALPLIEARAEKEYDTSSVYVVSTAGAIMSRSVRERLKEAIPSAHILDSFGSSETGYSGSEAEGSSPDEGLKFTMTARTAVISDDHRLLEPGSPDTGRVAQRGHIPLGYYNDPEKTAATFPVIDGERWVVTGDRARVAADGTIHVLGRDSACINSGGEKIFAEEVEAALKAHPDLVDATVVGVPDERWGEAVTAVVQVRDIAAPPTLADVEAHCAGRIARYKIPKAIHVVEKIERSPSGKPDYRWAKSVARSGGGVSIPTAHGG